MAVLRVCLYKTFRPGIGSNIPNDRVAGIMGDGSPHFFRDLQVFRSAIFKVFRVDIEIPDNDIANSLELALDCGRQSGIMVASFSILYDVQGHFDRFFGVEVVRIRSWRQLSIGLVPL